MGYKYMPDKGWGDDVSHLTAAEAGHTSCLWAVYIFNILKSTYFKRTH